MKRLAFAIILCLLFIHLGAQTQYPKHEVRAVWLTTIGGLDWPHTYAQTGYAIESQKRELCTILDQLQQANVNTVLLQTRIRATTIYPSAYEPWDGCLSGKPGVSPGYDALRFAIDECHRRGMEIHAWVVTIPVGKWNAIGCTRLRQKYPNMLVKIGAEGYMNPESEQTGNYLADICRELTRNYDIDGIHLDYIRYPETWNRRLNVTAGRSHITNIVRKIRNAVKGEKPWVKMSCSPIGKYDDLSRYWSHGWNARTKVCQEAQAWLRDGLMDELFPMMYFRGEQFFPFAIDWAENAYGKIVAPGLGIYMMHPRELNWSFDIIKRELNVLREYGMGHTYFRSKFFTENTKGIYQYVSRQLDRFPALVPPMTWQSRVRPLPPTHMSIKDGWLSWSGAADQSRSPYLLYNVYASHTYPVDVNDARNLVAARRQGTSVVAKTSNERPLYYAVTAMDRFGNESEPLQMAAPRNRTASATLMKNDGYKLQLPERGQVNDARYIIIESIAGQMVATRPWTGNTVSISRLPEGVYTVRSINAKHVTHRLGTFIIRR